MIQSDRGGQVTYHGPGQQVMYVLLDLKRNHIGVRQLVTVLENTVINTLAEFNVDAYARADDRACMLMVIKFALWDYVYAKVALFTV